MNLPTAYINGRKIEILPNRFQYEWEWDGPNDGVVSIDSRHLYDVTGQCFSNHSAGADGFPNRLTCFPWPLRKIEDCPEFYRDAALYMRTDQGNCCNWLYQVIASRSNRAYTWLKCRLILTAHVWGLAYVPPGTLISWRQLRRPRIKCPRIKCPTVRLKAMWAMVTSVLKVRRYR